jgi:predicted Zn-ribbon and HTH transcriptional regulator
MATGIKKTHEEFVNEVYDLVGEEYKVLGEYVNSNTKIRLFHNNCKNEYDVLPYNILSGKRCPYCFGTMKKTHDQFVNEIYNLLVNEYEFLTRYETAKTKIKVRHIKCGTIYSATPDKITGNARKGKSYCAICNGTTKSNTNEFKQRVFDLVADEYKVLGEYVKNQTPIKMIHDIDECGYVYYVKPNHFVISNTRCPACFGKNKLTTDQFKQIVYDAEGEEYLVLGEYENAKTLVKMKHNVENCGYIFDSLPTKFIHRNQRCPVCKVKSKGEYEISIILNNYNIEFKPQYKFDNFKDAYVLRFDFALLRENKLTLLIEYDGIQHFEPTDFAGKGEEWAIEQFIMTKQRDQMKNEYCKENNIPLFRIPYWKFDEIESIVSKLIHNEYVEIDENFIII